MNGEPVDSGFCSIISGSLSVTAFTVRRTFSQPDAQTVNRITPFPSRLPAHATRTGCFRRYGFPVPVLVCLLLASAARSETIYDLLEPPPAHRLWLEYNRGLEDSQSFYGELDMAIANGNRLLLGAGKSDVQGLTRRVDLYSYTVGLNTPWGEPFEAGVRYEFWGNTSELWTHTLSLPLTWNMADGYVGLRPGYTDIGLYVYRFNRPPRQTDTASQFIDLDIGYQGVEDWSLRLSTAWYRYDADLSRLQSPLASYLFSDITIVLGYGFPRQRLAGELTHDFGRLSLGAEYERTIVESDGSRLDVLSVKAAFRVDDTLGLYLQGGRIQADDTPDYNYLRLATDIGF